MNLRENIKVALQSVRSNLLRSVLTLLIIAFGIMALVGILTAIDSIIYSMSDNFSSLGTNSFTIEPKGEDGPRGRGRKRGKIISFKQAQDFKKRYDFPTAMVAVSMRGTRVASIKYQQEKTNPNVRVYGVDENELKVRTHALEFGRNFSETELQTGANVAIIGVEIVKQLFKDNAEKALQKDIRVGNLIYRVIGVLESKGASMNSNSDNNVFIPLLNGKKVYGSANKNYAVTVGVVRADQMDFAVDAATGIFRNVRKLRLGQDEDFEIFKSDGLISILKDNTVMLRLATVAIALITLIGAAIGLMNIMLVSVTERTREIGICKALGATRRNIMIQFLTEAIVICQMGGIVGIFLGILMGIGVTAMLGGHFVIPWAWIALGFGTCLIVGLFSGLYPALKASRLDPIESLRYE